MDLLDNVVFWSGCKSKMVRPPQSNYLYFNFKEDFIKSDNFIDSGGSYCYASSPSCRNAVWTGREIRLLTSQSCAPSVVMETFAMRTDVDIPVIFFKNSNTPHNITLTNNLWRSIIQTTFVGFPADGTNLCFNCFNMKSPSNCSHVVTCQKDEVTPVASNNHV